MDKELQGGDLQVDVPADEAPAKDLEPPASSSSSSSSSEDDKEAMDHDGDEQAEQAEGRAKLLEDLPWSVRKNFSERRERRRKLYEPAPTGVHQEAAAVREVVEAIWRTY